MDIEGERPDNHDDERSEHFVRTGSAPQRRRWHSGRPRGYPLTPLAQRPSPRLRAYVSTRTAHCRGHLDTLTLDIHRMLANQTADL